MREFFKKYWREFLLIALLITIIILFFTVRTSKQEAYRWEKNYYISQDSIESIIMDNGNLMYERDLYKFNFEELNKESQRKIKEIEKELNKSIQYISELKGNIKIDTLILKDSVWLNNNITHIGFHYNDTWSQLSGVTILDKDTITQLNSLSINVPLILSITKEQTIAVTSENPYVYFSSIDGALLNNTPKSFKHWCWSIEGGLSIQKGIFTKSLDVVPYVETDISYKFYNNINIGVNLGIQVQTSQIKTDVYPYTGLFVNYSLDF